MKTRMVFSQIFLTLSVVFFCSVSCQRMEEEYAGELNNAVFHAYLEPETKVFVNESLALCWNQNDKISLFNKTTRNQKYGFTGEDGDTEGDFAPETSLTGGNTLAHVYAVYPYSSSTSISTGGTITLTIPEQQPLGNIEKGRGSFAANVNPMVAVSDNQSLPFKSVCGYLLLKLYGADISVSSVALMGNNGEKISGNATATVIEGVPSLTMAENASSKIVLNCSSPSEMGASPSNYAEFWFVIPPVSFSKGFKIAVRASDGRLFEKTTNNPLTIDRNQLQTMAPLEVVPSEAEHTYLSFTALENNSKLSFGDAYNPGSNVNVSFEYSKDGLEWVSWDCSAITLNSGQTVYLKGDNPDGVTEESEYSFIMTGAFKAGGNVMSLIYGDNFEGETSVPRYGLSCLFYQCSSLKTAPALPATQLADHCYNYMFYGCTGLTEAPELPATQLANNCYSSMFSGCTGLTETPELPATQLADNCYNYMFSDCTGLTEVPELPATQLANNCYSSMFSGCTGLTEIPELPATELAYYCYDSMFAGCTGLTEASALPATQLANNCYHSMFSGCTGLTEAPALPATQLANNCYDSMFSGCTGLAEVPTLPASQLSERCYGSMFSGCTGLTVIPELPAMQLAKNCYQSMFSGCTGITTVSELPALTLVDYCYAYMFANCSKLNNIKMMATDISANNCLLNWVSGVSTRGSFYKNSSATWDVIGDSGVPRYWNTILYTPVVDNIELNYTSITLYCSETLQLSAEVHPANASDHSVTWQTSNSSIATVDDTGLVTTGRDGVVYITATSNSNSEVTATCKITVQPYYVYYTTTDGNMITLRDGAFDAPVLSHEYGIIKLGAPLTSIQDSAFSGIITLETMSLPEALVSIGNSAFSGCKGLKKIKCGQSISFPNLTTIGKNAFQKCTSLEEIVQGPSLTSIGSMAFYNCTSLEAVSLPSSLSQMGYGTFRDCTGLAGISFGGLSEIPEDACIGCTNLITIGYSSNVTTIGNSAFQNCEKLTSIAFFPNCVEIGEYAYSGCISLVTVTLPSGMTEIKKGTFSRCTGLTSVAKYGSSASVSILGESAFYGCTGLASFNFSGTVRIGSYCFKGCTNLKTLSYMSDYMTSIGNEAFANTAITEFYFPKAVTTVSDGVLMGCKNLVTVTLSQNPEYIGEEAFKDCTSLTRVSYFNSGVNAPLVRDRAFMNCSSLKQISFYSSLTKIGEFIFQGCTSLESITFKSTSVPVPYDSEEYEDYFFPSTYDFTGTIYVPSSRVNTYKTSTYFARYADCIQAIN